MVNSLKSKTQHSLPPIKRISQAEMNDRSAKGLCYYCDEKYVSGHQCKRHRIYWLERELETKEETMNDIEDQHLTTTKIWKRQ